jgi:DNA end-binding protein Ku
MKSLNKVAIGRIVIRSKERLVAIRPVDGALCVETMRYADEVLPADQIVPEGDVKLSEKERTMARQLVESLAAEGFEPEKYHDEYREQLLDLIARKESGEEIVAEPHTEPPAKVLDLVAALEASIAKSKTAKDRHPSGTGSRSASAAKPAAAKRATKSTSKSTKAPAKKAARAKRSA